MKYDKMTDPAIVSKFEDTDTPLEEHIELGLEIFKRYKNLLVERRILRLFLISHHGCEAEFWVGNGVCRKCGKNFNTMGIKETEDLLLVIAGAKEPAAGSWEEFLKDDYSKD
jgi:hypothetical protein